MKTSFTNGTAGLHFPPLDNNGSIYRSLTSYSEFYSVAKENIIPQNDFIHKNGCGQDSLGLFKASPEIGNLELFQLLRVYYQKSYVRGTVQSKNTNSISQISAQWTFLIIIFIQQKPQQVQHWHTLTQTLAQ